MPPPTTTRFLPGDAIFHEGDAGDQLYIIEQGEVEIWTQRRGRRERLRVLGPGALFGEHAAIEDCVRTASATALSAATLTVIRDHELRSRIDRADPVLQLMLSTLLRRQRGGSTDAPAPDASAVEKLQLEAGLRQAIDGDALELRYQPIVDLGSGQLSSLEALVRWHHPHRGPISPEVFIEVAEETPLIHAVNRWVLERACRDAAAIRAAGIPELPISINLSGHAVGRSRVIDELRAALRQHALPSAALRLEVTETVLVDAEKAIPWLARCRSLGFSVVIDDFGTGYSSLAYLRRLPADMLKLDQSFVQDLDHPRTRAIVAGILAMAAALGLPVVAEGIEDQAHADELRGLGCRYGQGYLFAPPATLDDTLDRLRP